MEPSLPELLVPAVWGAVGAVANLGVVFLEASQRVKGKGWPWRPPWGPGGGPYAVSLVVNLVIAAFATAAVSTAIPGNGLVFFGLGAAAPVVVKKVARYAQSLLPAQDPQPDDRTEEPEGGGDQA
ncbi:MULTISPECIES: hypothetical protein [Actinosynnema]|uniref:hypothetical protein n=1 Tax=Actinosynnema TaxID=40566 RepID=UPI0020A5F8D6|nr:hypothetical protein [Actinosynnema pretiosum]